MTDPEIPTCTGPDGECDLCGEPCSASAPCPCCEAIARIRAAIEETE